ncbi:MAG: PAS domain-containing protein [Chloroflexi bacterium]|nr:PAS domain-containing protein [Chloroflexota bacterium]
MAPAGTRWFQSRLAPETAPDGTVETVVLVTRDVTDRKPLIHF